MSLPLTLAASPFFFRTRSLTDTSAQPQRSEKKYIPRLAPVMRTTFVSFMAIFFIN